jgi:transcriptional regulator with XRE-family HTH domain
LPLYDHAKLRAWREEAGLTVTKAAAQLDISYSWLAKLETGNAIPPRLDVLDRLARFYGHGLAELLDQPAEPAEAAS